eukprot:gene10075-11104_t
MAQEKLNKNLNQLSSKQTTKRLKYSIDEILGTRRDVVEKRPEAVEISTTRDTGCERKTLSTGGYLLNRYLLRTGQHAVKPSNASFKPSNASFEPSNASIRECQCQFFCRL